MDWKLIESAQWKLRQHPLTSRQSIGCIEDLRIFMINHVYAVWDFMCLTKQLQQHLAPSGSPWVPRYSASSRRWINEIVLGEESDITMDGLGNLSHFESYIIAMKEIGIDTTWIESWPTLVETIGWENAIKHSKVPEPAKYFMTQTKEFVDSDKPWVICAALALGREDLLPEQFNSVLVQLENAEIPSNTFKWYLKRHVEIDGAEHGPAARKLLEELCNNDPVRKEEATEAALKAIRAREKYWDLIIQMNYSL
jgi:pyrroloquinoline quinone (PQQ) biosynthesis protein C